MALILVLILALAATYLARRALAREALVSWLNARGIEAEASFEALGPRGLTGRLRIGPADAPVLTTERAQLSYRLTGPWRGEAFGVELERIELFAPEISVRLTPEGPSLGVLDPLIAEFRSRPTRPDAVSPDVIVHDGRLQVDHEGGQALIHADAELRQGILVRLSGRLAPTRLMLDDVILDLGEARVGLVTREGRVSASLVAALGSGQLGEMAVGPGTLSVAINAPYPDLNAPLGPGPITAVANLRAASLARGGDTARAVTASASFKGLASGDLDRLALQGRSAARVDIGSGQFAGARFAGLVGSAQSDDLVWRRGPAGGLSARVRLGVQGRTLESGDIALRQVAADLSGPITHGAGGLTAELSGSAKLAGRFAGLGRPGADDFETVAAIKRAAQDFSLSTPSIQVAYDSGGPRMSLGRPASLFPASGGQVTVSGRGGAPVYADGGGAFDLKIEGGGLPGVDAAVRSYRQTENGLIAEARFDIATDLGPLEGLSTVATGRLGVSDGIATFRASGCAPISLDRFEAGDTSVDAIAMTLCPGSSPMLVAGAGQWRLSGRAEAISAHAGFLQARLQEGRANLVFGSGAQGLFSQATILGGRLMDAAEGPRFNPLGLTGEVRLAQDVWQGNLALGSGPRPIADVNLVHRGASGAGGVSIDTGRLTFAEEGRQPADLSPLAEAIGSPANGTVQFTGAFDWGPEGAKSQGRLSVFALDFNSPAGPVRGLSGDVDFTSLAPLETAVDQTLEAQELQLLAPLGSPRVTFQLLGQSLDVAGGAVSLGGGTVRLEPMSIPFDAAQSWRGELVVEGVQLADVVSATPFADRVSLTARVSGRLPFIVGPDGFRFVQGRLEAIEPGRISIRRAALTDVNASGGAATAEVDGLGETVAPAEETNTAVEFAYQAMEHLAFDLLDAEINSLPGGRLGVLFHIRGEHSPPQRQEIRLTLGELIRRDFLNRELPLPSGTKVDLTLDTSLNLDQLLADYAQAQAARGSGEVQAPDPQ